jgi:FKBP-type peptidyl-prolyl cis-trans isomerase
MTLTRVLGVLLLSPLLGSCAWFRPKPPEYEWVSLGDELELRDVVVPMEGPEVGPGDEVQLHYDLSLEDETPVESSRERGQPIQVTLGTGTLPVGLERGLVGMKLYGRRRIVVPPALGYGSEGRPPFIPPDATLVFDVEVLGLVPAGGGAPEAQSPEP